MGFVSASQAEIRDGSAFAEAARFCEWESTVVIRCEQTGQDLQVHCPPPSVALACEITFRNEWVRKHGSL